MHQLSGVQRDLLIAIQGLGPISGQDLVANLNDEYEKEVSNPQLYENLDKLCKATLVTKKEDTGARHNDYQITPHGKREIAAYDGWAQAHIRP